MIIDLLVWSCFLLNRGILWIFLLYSGCCCLFLATPYCCWVKYFSVKLRERYCSVRYIMLNKLQRALAQFWCWRELGVKTDECWGSWTSWSNSRNLWTNNVVVVHIVPSMFSWRVWKLVQCLSWLLLFCECCRREDALTPINNVW